ncbi:MAG: bifunctional diaminohydroxyphosphoribosylaminopyrimidine deaminase/5-amino-6-(5-phosphoribosylamino)uracil reductase RibD [Trueperaceae bacterium]|nr:bifunctional diaminohydroxyphosphoribosylaminopyrimidine deaminase/5-amino-6-(5-phosphoribosylamino)uracil reductase RibD [Trueperaceae bacterium]
MSAGGSEPVLEHEKFMAQALDLAEQGRGSTAPNPMVGCVIVRDGDVIGEGYHAKAGEAHAEVNALRDAGDANGATVYVTLEPCNHHGRTPPCTDALVDAGVRRVVIAATDPNPKVDGQGIARLQDAGIEVIVGVMQDEAETQNEVFRTVQTKKRPFVLYKTAMTLDGKIATRDGQSRWITGAASRDLVQQWRNDLDAIAVGVNTVLRDDPKLTCRLDDGHTPTKIVFDSVARTPADATLFEPDPRGAEPSVVIFVTDKAPSSRVDALQARGADVVRVSEVRGRTDVSVALQELYERGITSLLLEGGGTLAWSFFEARAVDKVAVFIGPKLVGGGGASPLAGLGVSRMDEAITLDGITTQQLENDFLISGTVVYRPSDVPEQAGIETETQTEAQTREVR